MAKAKKMTLKEFKEVFEKAGFSMEVWGYEGILNLIAGNERYQYEQFAGRPGYDFIASTAKRHYDALYNALDARGYYNN